MDTSGFQLLLVSYMFALVMQAGSNPMTFVIETEEIGLTGIFISLLDIHLPLDSQPCHLKLICIVEYRFAASS
jgi:hypothetical protein